MSSVPTKRPVCRGCPHSDPSGGRAYAVEVPIVDGVLFLLAMLAVFAIAAATIGREAHRLDAVSPRTIYDVDEAVAFVSDAVPAASQARLTPDEVRTLLRIHMGRLHQLGLQPTDVTDRPQDIAVPTFLEEVDEVAYVIGGAEANGVEVVDADVAEVVDAHLAYLDRIGAVGPPADTDERAPE